jgi:hypothetical protein
MATQRLLEVINALKTVWDAAAALNGVRISKAWEIIPEGDVEHVFIGSDVLGTGLGAGLGADDVAAAVIEWPGMSPLSRTEDGTINCAASVWIDEDETGIDAAITRAFVIVGACEDVLRANPSLSSSFALQAKIAQTRLRLPTRDSEGFAVVVPFTVAYQTSV